ncbi:hypothetical protein LT85_0242 [Collimonas arenae]|uniref:Uncharacterized protein n=1 Tax=Collimonas arenae TaxID=279058 RepID=A0A0A1F966_9BURK|nr:hypothetical protein LT85_0242 [Collimonas arenae]
MKDRRAADWAKPEHELRALVSGAQVFRSDAGDTVRRGETGQCSEDATGSALARQAIADTDATRFAVDVDTKLATRAGSGSGCHEVLLMKDLATSNVESISHARRV